MSSIAALGVVGGAEDLALLRQLRPTADKHLHKALDSAIQAIEKRQASLPESK